MTAAVGSNTNVPAYLQQLQFGLSSLVAGLGSGISSLEQAVETATANANGSGPVSGASYGPTPPFSPGTLASLMSIQEQLGGASNTQGPPGLFAKLDANGDGQIGQPEFESELNGAGVDTQSAGALFSQLDSNGDGSIGQSELPQALGRGHHHHHHGSGAQSGGAGSAQGAGPASLLDASDPTGAQTQTTTNADGSTTTTISYADGSSVSTTVPAAQSASSPGTASNGVATPSGNNVLERLIQLQAQLLTQPNPVQSAVS